MTGTRAMFVPLRNRVFRRVWTGQLISVTGDAAFVVALAALLVQGQNSATTLSVAVAVLSTGSIFSVLVGGILADRFRRSRLIISADILRIGGTALVIASGSGDRLSVLVGGVVLIGVGEGLHQPVYQALFPTLIDADDRQAANALRSLSNRAASILGAAAAAALIAAGSAEWAIAINGATYLVSIVTLIGVADVSPSRAAGGQSPATFLTDASAGLAYVWKRKWMLAVMLGGMAQIAFITTPLAVILPIALRDQPGVFGLVVASQSAGAVLGSIVGARSTYQNRGIIAILAAATEGLVMVAAAMGVPAAITCLTAVVGGAGLAFFAVIWVTALQDEVPDHLRGRVFSLDLLSAIGFAPLAAIVAGLAVQRFGVVATAWSASAALAVSTVLCLAVPGVRTFRDPSAKRDRHESVVTDR